MAKTLATIALLLCVAALFVPLRHVSAMGITVSEGAFAGGSAPRAAIGPEPVHEALPEVLDAEGRGPARDVGAVDPVGPDAQDAEGILDRPLNVACRRLSRLLRQYAPERGPEFFEGVQAFLSCAESLKTSPLYRGDAIEQAAAAYRQRNAGVDPLEMYDLRVAERLIADEGGA